MYDFTYHRPASLAEAARLLADNEEAKLLAGGQTLIPVLKQRLARPSGLIDIGRLGELQGIGREGQTLVVGAGTRHAAVAGSDVVRSALPALAFLAGEIGDPQVRHMGTLGGSIANNDPSADYPAALLALGATVHTSRRSIPAESFFTGLFQTALERDELVLRVGFPIPQAAAYEKFPSPASRYALAGIFVARTASGARLAVTGIGPAVFRQKEMETALDRSFSPAALDGIAIAAEGFNSDLHASAAYRAHLLRVVAQRAVRKLI
jgi:aerobic carbon-monoxide dehydrogenase medium subunit